MKALFVFAIAVLAATSVAQAQAPTQNPAQKQAQKQAQKPAAKAEPVAQPLTAFCQMDSRRVGDKVTWCDGGRLLQCNAASGTWTNTGKVC
jgi:hypothetical protein